MVIIVLHNMHHNTKKNDNLLMLLLVYCISLLKVVMSDLLALLSGLHSILESLSDP